MDSILLVETLKKLNKRLKLSSKSIESIVLTFCWSSQVYIFFLNSNFIQQQTTKLIKCEECNLETTTRKKISRCFYIYFGVFSFFSFSVSVFFLFIWWFIIFNGNYHHSLVNIFFIINDNNYFNISNRQMKRNGKKTETILVPWMKWKWNVDI